MISIKCDVCKATIESGQPYGFDPQREDVYCEQCWEAWK